MTFFLFFVVVSSSPVSATAADCVAGAGSKILPKIELLSVGGQFSPRAPVRFTAACFFGLASAEATAFLVFFFAVFFLAFFFVVRASGAAEAGAAVAVVVEVEPATGTSTFGTGMVVAVVAAAVAAGFGLATGGSARTALESPASEMTKAPVARKEKAAFDA